MHLFWSQYVTWSLSSRTFKLRPQKPPTAVQVFGINPSTVRVTWRYVAPTVKEEPLTGYKVSTCQPGHRWQKLVTDGNSWSQMAIDGHFWSHLAAAGYSYQKKVTHSNIWSHWATAGYISRAA